MDNIINTIVFDELGNIKRDKEKKTRKSKKQNEKEIMNEYYLENENSNSITNKKKIYENMQYLSLNERNKFESKFTKPIKTNM